MVHMTGTPSKLDATDPDLIALTVTIGHVAEVAQTGTGWDALAAALTAEHTPEQLTNMLLGACALIVQRSQIL